MFCEEFINKHGVTQYRFVERYTDPLTNKRKQVSVVMNKNGKQSQKEAQKRLNAKIDDKLNNISNTKLDRLTFYQACEEWYEHYVKTSGSKRTTVKTIRSTLNGIENNFDHNMLVVKMDAKIIQKRFNEWNVAVTYGHLVKCKNIIRGVFKYVKAFYGLKDISFFEDITVPKKARTLDQVKAKKNNYLEESEVKELLVKFDEMIENTRNQLMKRSYKRIKSIVEFQILNGLRIGELLAIKVNNVDLDSRKLEVDGSLVREPDKNGRTFGVKDTTKNESSYRVIDLTDRSCEILRRVMLENKASKQWDDNYFDNGFIFTNNHGSPMQLHKINLLLKNVVEITSFKDKKVTSHTLRHTHISTLAQLGIPIKAIMERVGHSNQNTTIQIYTHVTDRMNKDALFKLNNLEKNG